MCRAVHVLLLDTGAGRHAKERALTLHRPCNRPPIRRSRDAQRRLYGGGGEVAQAHGLAAARFTALVAGRLTSEDGSVNHSCRREGDIPQTTLIRGCEMRIYI
eukprot:scaffold131300_cov63-Phaeocystis_antarctica.AAC.3